jgi:transcriptional regulator with XRE-family HTH domain
MGITDSQSRRNHPVLADAGTVLFMPKSTEALVFGRRLKELRKRRGLSQKELAAAISVHQFQISKYETGSYFPTVGNVIEIARYLQVGLAELFGEVIPDEAEVRNLRLLHRFRDLETLPKDDQDVVVKLIDAWIAKGKIRKLVS